VSCEHDAPAPLGCDAPLYVHASGGRNGRDIDNATEAFVEATRMGAEKT